MQLIQYCICITWKARRVRRCVCPRVDLKEGLSQPISFYSSNRFSFIYSRLSLRIIAVDLLLLYRLDCRRVSPVHFRLLWDVLAIGEKKKQFFFSHSFQDVRHLVSFFSSTPLSSTSSLFQDVLHWFLFLLSHTLVLYLLSILFQNFRMVLFLLFPPCPLPPLVLSRCTALGSFFSSTPLSSTSSLFQDVRHWFSTSLCLPHSLLLFKICGSLSHTVVLTSSLFQYVRHWFTLSAILYYRTPTQQHVHLPNQRQHRPVHLAPPSF